MEDYAPCPTRGCIYEAGHGRAHSWGPFMSQEAYDSAKRAQAAFASHILAAPSLESVLLWAVARNIVALAFDPVTQSLVMRAALPAVSLSIGFGTPRATDDVP